MRAASPALKAYLQNDGLELAMLLKLKRQDGALFGFTTWDLDIKYDDGSGDGLVTYEASNAVIGSAIRQEAGTGVDNLDVMGVLRSDRVRDVDLLAGLYDSAAVWMCYVNPRDLSMGHLVLTAGVIGDVKTADGQYTVEFRSKSQLASQQIGELVTPTCRVLQLGDSRCKVVMSGTTRDGKAIRSTGTVTAVVSQHSIRASGIVTDAGFYNYGSVKFLDGANAGIGREVKAHGQSAATDVLVGTSLAADALVPWSPSACGLSFTAPIPAGVWASGYVLITVRSKKTAVEGNDQVWLQAPTGTEYLVGAAGDNGDYNFVVQLGASSVAAINAAAGGNLACCFRHGAPGATQYVEARAHAVQFTLQGVPAAVSDLLVLAEPFPFDVQVGDTATVEAGCDRLVSTCSLKFRDPANSAIGNTANFRGEPYVPGMDQLLQRGRA